VLFFVYVKLCYNIDI